MRSLFFVCSLFCALGAPAADFRPVLLAHAKRYPRMEARDCYKLLFQAVLGAEHAATDEAAARRWMDDELAALGDGPAEPLVDAISPDGALVRVHLRSFVARGGDSAKLVHAFVATAEKKFGPRGDLVAAWRQAVALAEEKKLPFTAEAARAFGEKMRAADWPAVHHSKTFAVEYRPAYRVIARELLGEVLPTLSVPPTSRSGRAPGSRRRGRRDRG
ncbi:MAG: hypothetical protein HYV96_21235 [Opitutae bacterium]|nr:hypothetical protein [Opitutae bacterium]